MPRLFGKYRAVVDANVDPLRLGRLRVSSADSLGPGDSAGATPCLPYAEPGVGLLALPPVGAGVWIEFEGGNS